MSSHREAPEISKDPVADSADLYAFVSPDRPGSVTIIANYVPLQGPDGGPNFYEFGNDVLYQINVDNDGDGVADITYDFTFQSKLAAPTSFLYNDGPIESIDSPAWNRRQFFDVSVTAGGRTTMLGTGLACPPCNIGPLSTPNYPALAAQAVHQLGSGRQIFAGQRRDGFYVDLGAIFDLGDLRPLANLHATFGLPKLAASKGLDSTRYLNVHSIALQVPIADLTRNGVAPSGPLDTAATIGVWTTASRRKARVWDSMNQAYVDSGPWVQVSRLGNPLINEVIIPIGKKDLWNRSSPSGDASFRANYQSPQLAELLPVLYPGAFPNLATFNATGKPRSDLVAVLLTGIPTGVASPSFQNYTGHVQADMLRLNVAVPPATKPNSLGVIGGDVAGFPNGRRVFDDVVTIELRALAGTTLPLVDKAFKADAAVDAVTDGLDGSDEAYLSEFPYLGLPTSGYDTRVA
jgi:Domain of unknown function (DUF4331)